MVKTVVGEETQLQLAELRLSQSGIFAQVGLVIGKLSSILDKGFVFDLIPTPPNDAGEPPCSLVDSFKDVDKKKGSKAKSSADSSSLVIDEGWVTEHARQVSRMLVGGIRVIGIYVWIGESTFKNSTITLCQTVKGVAEAAPLSASDWDERLLVHICYSPRRWTCRNCSLASNITPSHLRPCDFKMGKVLGTLQSFRCMYNFDMRLPIYQENMSSIRTLNDILQNEISIHAKELKGAKGLVDGNLVIEDEPCTSDGQHKVELLLPFMKDACLEASSQKEIVGVLVFAGSVCSYAYLNSKQPISEALADIKEDIIMSLRSRLDIICDEADRQTGVTADGVTEENNEMPTLETVHQLILEPLRKQATLQLPRRIFIPWLAGTFICDYLQPSETFEKKRFYLQDSFNEKEHRVLKDHFVELLSMEPPADASTILEPETGTPSLSIQSFWAVAAPLYPASVPESLASKNKYEGRGDGRDGKLLAFKDINTMVVLFILLLSISAGLVLYSRNEL